MRIFGQALLVACAVLAARVPQTSVARGTEPFGGRLYVVVSSWREHLNPDDVTRVAPLLRPRFERFMRCEATFRSRLPEKTDFFARAALPHQRALERALACLVETPGIAELAADYSAHARILYEWEGLSSSPLEEAEYAERYITDHQGSPLVPYLYLFVAERVRYAFELLAGEKNQTGMAAAATRYRTFIDRARKADPMIGLVADDLDGLAFVYRDVGKHPRDFRDAAHVELGAGQQAAAPDGCDVQGPVSGRG
jgi:hypothetical protein